MSKRHSYTVEEFAAKYKLDGEDLREVLPIVMTGSGRITTATIKRAIVSVPPDHQATEAWVYFIHAPRLRLIKIGYSTNPDARLRALRVGVPVDMRIIGKVRGGLITEKVYHEKFKHLRVGGEWFRATKYLVALASLYHDDKEDQ